MQPAGQSARTRPVPARRCRGWCRRARTGSPAGMLACMSRHRQGRGDHDHALILDQAATSQISAATRIATNSTTTMTAAGIVRSLRSCLCTSVLLAVDGAEHGGGPARSRVTALALSAAPAALTVAEATLARSALAPPPPPPHVPATPPAPPLPPPP